MSIHFISGKPGGGKSLFAVRKLIDDLVLTDRTIVTNIALNLPELSAYLQERYPNKSIDLHRRVRIIGDDESREFYLFRGRDKSKDDAPYGDWYNCDKPTANGRIDYSYAITLGSVLYVIDEAHLFWNARSWQNTGPAVMFYNSQHRKIGDDVLLISQHVMNVDKQMRSLVQDYTYIRNHRKERFALFFRSIPFFTRSVYMEPYTGSQNQVEAGVFKLDVSGICKCYFTQAGIGIMGREADTKEPRKGLPMTLLMGIFILLGIGAFYIPDLIAKGVNHTIDRPFSGKSVQTTNVTGMMPSPVNMVQAYQQQKQEANTSTNEPLTVAAYWNLGKGPVATLSDGSVWTVDDGLQMTSKRGVMIKGTNYQWQQKVTPRPINLETNNQRVIYKYKDLTNRFNKAFGF